jgi:hypothetical protein
MKSGSSYFNTEICQETKDDRSGKEKKKNPQQRRPPSSPRELGKRENITRPDGIMRGYNYNKVCGEWKTLASENKDGEWEQLEAEWIQYIEDNDSLYFYGRSRKRKLNNSTDSEDMPPLPLPTEAMEIMLDDDDDYMPDCPWKRHDYYDDSPARKLMMDSVYELPWE